MGSLGRRVLWRMVFWTVVMVPLGYGVYQTLRKAMLLFG